MSTSGEISGLGDPDDAYDLDLATAGLLADGQDIHILLNVLAKQLGSALGERLVIERKGGLLHRSDEIKALEARIGKETFRADLDKGAITTTVGHASGGIRIRSESVEVDEWLRRLLTALKAEAVHSQTARLALENIVIGGPA